MDDLFDDSPDQGSGFDVAALWRMFWRRKWLFFIPFVLCLAMALVAIKTMTPIYASSGQIQLRTDFYRSQLLNDPLGGSRRRDLDREIRREMETLLTSPDFLEKIVRELGMDKTVEAAMKATGQEGGDETRSLRVARNRLARQLRLEPDGAHLFRIEVRDTDARRAYDLTRFILDRFLEEYRKVRMAPRASTREFLVSQREVYQADLQQAENTLNSYLGGIASAGLLDNPINAGNLATAEDGLSRMRDRHAGTDTAELISLRQSAGGVLGAAPAAETYRKDGLIKDIQLELTDLGVQMFCLPEGAAGRDDLELRSGRLRVQLNNRVEELVAGYHPSLGIMDRNRISQYLYFVLHLEVEQSAAAKVGRFVRTYRDFLVQQPMQSTQLAELQAKVTRASELVQTIDREITQMRMNLEAGMSDVGLQVLIRRQASYEPWPVEPDKRKLAFMGFVLSLGMGTGLVILAIFMDKTFRSVDMIEAKLGLPVLGTLPLIRANQFERKRQVRLLFWVTIVVGILAVAAFGFLVLYPMLSR